MGLFNASSARQVAAIFDRIDRRITTPALRLGMRRLRRDGLRAWKLDTPRVTGLTRSKLAAREYRVRTGRRLDFVVRYPASQWFSNVENRHGMTKKTVLLLRRRARPTLARALQQKIAELGG